MLSSVRFSILACSVLLLGLALNWHRRLQHQPDAKSLETYWADTQLNSSALEDLLQDVTCESSERYFLACANSIMTMASRFSMTLDGSGKLTPLQPSTDNSTEKKQLQQWKEHYHSGKGPQSFVQSWLELDRKFIRPEQRSMIIGIGLNAFISVFKDPHTYLMPVSQFQEVVSKADSRSLGLGLQLGLSDGLYVIKKIHVNGPAFKAGLLKGDQVVSIGGQRIKGIAQGRVSDLLRGESGESTDLQIKRPNQEFKVKLTRKEIVIPTVVTQVIDGIKPVAVISINKFAKNSCEMVKGSLATLQKSHVRGLLLDLRDNPGGQMEEAACIVSLFVGPEKKVFEIRYLDSSKDPETYYGWEDQVFHQPVAVLVNAASASAAEIVAGSLRDLGRAVLVGERTFGKGSFQEGEYWSQNRKIALFETKGFYYLPSGESPQMKGLEPDVFIKSDMIEITREAEAFINPLLAPPLKAKLNRKAQDLSSCLAMEDSLTGIEDLGIAKAKEILFCNEAVAGGQQ